MRIALVAKFPPIQGGVSTQVYWTTQYLAARGHEVHVITNAEEVEFGFRSLFWGSDLDSSNTHGRVIVHSTTPLGGIFVPSANPFSSKLFGLALSVFGEQEFDIIVGWYFEPYGIVAAQVANATRTPLLLRHAGSDVGRLARHPELRSAFQWMFSRAEGVLTMTRSAQVLAGFRDLGLAQEQLVRIRKPRIPVEYSNARPVNVRLLREQLPVWLELLQNDVLQELILPLGCELASGNGPTVTIMGKIGETKGTSELIRVLRILAERDVDFRFLCPVGGHVQDMVAFYSAIRESSALSDRTVPLPLVAPWRVPEVLAASDIVCVLERDFPFAFHQPRTVREALSAGSCLVCSNEVADKQGFRELLVDGHNVILATPSNLLERVSHVLSDGFAKKEVAEAGRLLSNAWESRLNDFDSVGTAIEEFVN